MDFLQQRKFYYSTLSHSMNLEVINYIWGEIQTCCKWELFLIPSHSPSDPRSCSQRIFQSFYLRPSCPVWNWKTNFPLWKAGNVLSLQRQHLLFSPFLWPRSDWSLGSDTSFLAQQHPTEKGGYSGQLAFPQASKPISVQSGEEHYLHTAPL